MQNGFKKYLIAILICIPLFFINVKEWTDWGDDFAQYIHQSLNIINGIPQNETGYLFNKDYPLYAPQAYPAGFPLLLTPILKWGGINFFNLSLYITLFLTLYGILIFAFLKRYYSSLISILLLIILLYNPWTLSFKGDILSDIPFSVFLLLAVILYTSFSGNSKSRLLLTSVVGGFAILTRSVGIVFPIAVFCYSVFEFFLNKNLNHHLAGKKLYSSLMVATISLLFFFILNKFIFPVTSDNLFSYKMLIDFGQMKNVILTNLTYYTGVLRAFFEPWNDQWHFVSVISSSMIFCFIVIGIIKKMMLNFEFTDMLFIVYLIVIIIYPYSNAGFRFLFPLAPFLLLYFMKGILSVDLGLKVNRKLIPVALTIVVLFSYKKGISEVIKTQHIISEGPQLYQNREMFEYIKQNTNPDARFSFKRPRALALYTGRNCMSHRNDASPEEIDRNIQANHIGYILINREDFDQNMIDYVKTNENKIEKIWENSENTIYIIKAEK